ncbi:MAG: HAD family phosphatase [Desulfobacteraceae bacterium]|nr:MAG: HAD family phosphatase [Desulfobacteraceae bacterium]
MDGEPQSSMYSAVLWDNDGVLVDTEKYYFLATRMILSEVQVELTEALFCELFLVQSKGAWHLAAEKGVSQEGLELLRSRRNELYLRMLCGEEIAVAGVEDTLQRLAGKFRMAIVTSSHRDHFDAIHRRTGFLKYFDLVLTREDYRHSKPDPEPYLRATELLKVDPQFALAIEDSKRGLTAAKRAGLACWAIPNRLSSIGDFAEADRVLTDVREVAALLLPGSHPPMRHEALAKE